MEERDRVRVGPTNCHLSYCSNIHPGESWPEVFANLRRFVPAVKERVAPDRAFGVGLRLSGAAAEALGDASNLDELKSFLRSNGLYVFTVNGFPYGTFHRKRVKEEVYLPDWRDDARVDYTNALADVLAALLPDELDVAGTVSSVPGAFRVNVESEAVVQRMTDQMVRHAAHLVRLHRTTGRVVTLALEPEPACFLETLEETASFFEHRLFGARACDELRRLTGMTPTAAAEALRRHVGVCLDLCHAAVEFEDAAAGIARLRRAGIAIAKVQVSAGLRIERMTHDAMERLRRFDDGVYLHQVVERNGDVLTRYTDLAPAFLAAVVPSEREWRVHFHVPVFLADLGAFTTTQSFLADVLALHRASPISNHLEVETYTWDVLPPAYRTHDVVTAIVRELQWVEQQLAG